jgi:predicted DNA-binding transcriptional regulator YafY
MQIDRLFMIVYMLLTKRTITAGRLAEHFHVSTRTIYRDIDTLSAAGIPVYTNKGKGGGICLLEDFILNQSLLSGQEQKEILIGLHSLQAANFPEIETVIMKLSALFKQQSMDWIEVDFSKWGSDDQDREKFKVLQTAISNETIVSFDYFSSAGEKSFRVIEPLKLVFKGRAWYCFGFCRNKQDYRIFKITRIQNLSSGQETFKRESPPWPIGDSGQASNLKMINFTMIVDAQLAYRVYDEFSPESIVKNADGSFTVSATYPENEWVYGYVLSFGNFAKVVEPCCFRETIKEKLKKSLEKYE